MITYSVPRNWFWIIGGDTSRAWSSAAGAYVTTWPPDCVTRIASEVDLSDVLRPFNLIVPRPTSDDVQREYWRRLCLVLGAHDLAHAGFIRADDNAELQALLGVASPTAEQTARITELEVRDAAVVAVIDAYNAIPTAPVPADYAAAPRWP